MKKKSKLQKKVDDVSSRLWRNKADKAWREIVFILAKGCCEVCGSKEYPNAHHIFPRNISIYRHEYMNGILLCPSDHKYNFKFSAHKNPMRFAIWLIKNQPKRWEWLLQHEGNMESPPKINYKEIYLSLDEKLKSLTNILQQEETQNVLRSEIESGNSEIHNQPSPDAITDSKSNTGSNNTQDNAPVKEV